MADSQRKTANLFDKDNATDNYYVNASDGSLVYNTASLSSDYILIEQGKQYYWNDSGTRTNAGAFYDANKNFVSGWSTNVSGELYFTTPTNAMYVRLTGRKVEKDVLQLNEGSTALPYEPYGWVHSLRKLGTSTDTLTTLPADVYAGGNNATVGLVGNMVQNGSPSPSSIIMPQECGERTGNLFNKSVAPSVTRYPNADTMTLRYDANVRSTYIPCKPNTTYTICKTSASRFRVATTANTPVTDEPIIDYETNASGSVITLTTSATVQYLFVWYWRTADTITEEQMRDSIMIVESSTAPSTYIPYGIEIPISSANTTTPVYLGEVQTTRKVKKLVLTGQESWTAANGGTDNCFFYMTISDSGISNDSPVISSHFVHATVNNTSTDVGLRILSEQLRIRPNSASTTSKADFQQYLANQYANGTPVCVWYVLATEETGIVNEPIRKIGDYADTVSGITIPTITGKDSFDVLTTLKPSEVSLAYTGWHDATVKEWDGSEWQ